MVTNYDVIQDPFLTIEAMENYEGNSNFPPYQTVARHVVDVRGRSMGQVLPYTRRYVRSGPVPSSTEQGGAGDPHAYDIGLFQVGVSGMPSTGNQVGELWVGYSIDLIKPRPSVFGLSGGASASIHSPSFLMVTEGNANWVTAVPPFMETNGLDVEIVSPNRVLVHNPLGRAFLIVVMVRAPNDADAPVFNGYNHFDSIIGGTYVSSTPALTSTGVATGIQSNTVSSSINYAVIQADENAPVLDFTVVPTTALSLSPEPNGNIVIMITNYDLPSVLTHRVFLPSSLAKKSEIEMLKNQFEQLRLSIEEKEEERSERFSVVSSVSTVRPPSRVSSLKK